ncbi:MAG: MFS transporter [Ignavibacteria bacterium]|nr:MFS transporter [Ignavibacteria bacterium]
MNVGIDDTGTVTSSIQFGFITGAVIFALLAISNRCSPRKIFLICSVLGAISNLLIYFIAYDLFSLLVIRFITGFFLTGIYPIGMKIAAGCYKRGLGNAIGLLVRVLVLGTASPHLINSIGFAIIILSLWFVNHILDVIDYNLLFLLLAIGPITGLIFLKPLLTSRVTINNLN